jgi:hypothetical protein
MWIIVWTSFKGFDRSVGGQTEGPNLVLKGGKKKKKKKKLQRPSVKCGI